MMPHRKQRRPFWGDSFDGLVNNLFELQDRVVVACCAV
jgi:hypothetical protein